ncbi:uncharacterized protein [Euphorbia lathyris]|uniref:uncharacterized protein isoform X3 n=1 Tax=Euphorbia lathyris TaxID=212925 RepID=UPI003313D383
MQKKRLSIANRAGKQSRTRKRKRRWTMAAINTVKYGIIGVGMMGREHLINLYHLRSQNVAVVCIADPHLPSQQLALQLAQSFNWSLQVFSGHQELLDSGLCDVVVVSSPNMTHYQILMDIINHPKPHHVLVEKPLCTTVDDCKKVVDAARKRSDILVQVGLEYRYMPPVAKLIEIVEGGSLGQVKMVAIREHRFPFLVKVNDWNRFNANTGGTLVEKCCHFFDLMRLFAGANPVRVMASGAIDVNHKDEVYDGKENINLVMFICCYFTTSWNLHLFLKGVTDQFDMCQTLLTMHMLLSSFIMVLEGCLTFACLLKEVNTSKKFLLLVILGRGRLLFPRVLCGMVLEWPEEQVFKH